MSDAVFVRRREDNRVTLAAAAAAGEVRQLADGRVGVLEGLNAAAINDRRQFVDTGKFTFPKAAGVLLDGGRAYWDYSANNVTYKKVNDRDFYLGRFVGDAATGDTECVVDINVDPPYDIDMLGGEGGFLSVPTGTQAVGEFGFPKRFGKSILLELTATNEAQCNDALSVDRFDKAANAIVELIMRLATNGSGAAVDLSLGIGNGTSTTDADAITEHVLFHVDGGALDILAQSKDGTTTVAATDTTVDATAGSAVANRFEFWIDTRDPANVKLYINGARVLSGSTFKIDAATGPFGILAHIEKTAGTTTGQVYIDRATARYAEQ